LYTEINREIYELETRIRAKEKLAAEKDMLVDELQRKRREHFNLHNDLLKEKADVDKLEGMSFSAIFLSMLGKKEDRLDKEREELLAAELRYKESQELIQELEKKIKDLEGQLVNFEDIKERYNKLIKEKKRLLLGDDSYQGRRLREALEHINELKLDIKEVDEAIYAGDWVLSALNKMEDQLESAKGWATWDILGGGMFVDMAKHSAIDKANQTARDVQHLLKSFNKELSDVGRYTDIKVDISGFATFADFFFDGLFVDWFVKSKINNSLSKVRSVRSEINRILDDLRRNRGELNNQKSSLEKQIEVLLKE
jgi:hypothetical protein